MDWWATFTTMMYFLHLIAIVLMLIANIPVFSTCIVIYKQGNKYYIGADSKRVMSIYIPKNLEQYKNTPEYKKLIENNKPVENYCKIHNVNNYTIAVAGSADGQLLAIAKGVLQNNRNYQTAMTTLYNTLKREMIVYLEQLRNADPEQFRIRFKKSSEVGAIAVVAYENGNPVNSLQIVKVVDIDKPKMKIEIGGGVDEELYLMGTTEAIWSKYKTRDNILKLLNLNPIKSIKDFIEFQKKAFPEGVGGPIDILEITPTGKRWIAQKPNCSD